MTDPGKSLFGRADAVIFPVDCVSHAALAEIKRLYRRWNKPYLPIRRSGLSALARALEATPTRAARFASAVDAPPAGPNVTATRCHPVPCDAVWRP